MEQINWGLPLTIDLYAAALGAALFMVAVAADLAGGERYRRISTTGALLAPWPVIIGVILLIVDLGKPGRFWEMILRRSHETLGVESLMFKFGSTMSMGTWLLIFFIIGSLVYMIVAILSFPFKWAQGLQKILGVIGLPFALLVTVYTGVLLSASSNSLWNNLLLPIVFVTSAFVTAIASIVLIMAILKFIKPDSSLATNMPKLEKINTWVISFQLLVVIVFVVVGLGSPRMRALIGSAFGLLWWIGIIGLGLIVPLGYGLLKGFPKKPEYSIVVSSLVLLGGFFLRYSILVGGQIPI